jgi:hypothetical protein
METLRWLNERFARTSQSPWEEVITDATGFRVGSKRLDWSQVTSISAFKRDRLTLDDVWFHLEGPEEPTLVCEEQPGFAEWEATLRQKFPAVASWRESVIHPPFAENFIVLYRRT